MPQPNSRRRSKRFRHKIHFRLRDGDVLEVAHPRGRKAKTVTFLIPPHVYIRHRKRT